MPDKIPEEMKDKIVTIKADPKIVMAARLEAALTVMKIRYGHPGRDRVFLDPEIVTTKEDSFNYGILFQKYVMAYASGDTEIPLEVQEAFASGFQKDVEDEDDAGS